MEKGYGVATVTTRGQVLGTAKQPSVVNTAADLRMDMTVTIDDQSYTHTTNQTFSPGDTDPAPLPVDAVSCDTVTGSWTDSPYAFLDTEGWYVATRTEDLSEDEVEAYRDELASLLERGHAIREQVRDTGTVDPAHLDALLQQAEDLRNSLDRSLECGDASLDRFVSPLEGVMTDLLDFMIDNPGALTDESMSELVTAAAETGALNSEAASDTEDIERRTRLAEQLRDRADRAAAEGDCEALAAIRRANGATEGSMLDPAIADIWSSACG